MAISSFPFDSQDTTESQFSRLMGQFHDSGVAASANSGALKVVASGGDLTAQVGAGFAVLNGFGFLSTANETVSLPAPSSGTAIHRVVLTLSMVANQIVLEVVQGTPGQGVPAITQADPGASVSQLPLAQVSVTAGQTAILPSDITDERAFLNGQVGTWLGDAQRPSAPRVGKMGYNVGRRAYEHWDGTQWSQVGGDTPGTIKMHVKIEPGYLALDGSTHSNATYPALAAALGQGGTTFTLPDMRDAYPKGATGNGEVFDAGGANLKAISSVQMPAHNHVMSHDHGRTNNDGAHEHGHLYSDSNGTSGTMRSGSWGRGRMQNQNGRGVMPNSSAHNHEIAPFTGNTGTEGEGQPFNVEPAHVSVLFVIKT